MNTLVGQTFGRLTVVEQTARTGKQNGRHWRCRCSCGAERVITTYRLTHGEVFSCGCYKIEKSRRPLTHGHTVGGAMTPTFESWRGMIERCGNPKHVAWARYGGRGISVCARWLAFENFLADMGERPARLELDRINNDGNYEPGNCRWTTRIAQMRHKKGLPFGSRAPCQDS